MVGLTPLFGPVGPEILIVIALIILLFGANKLPEVARATGKSLSEFK
jgi:sec-independent protein translocase protein TatA